MSALRPKQFFIKIFRNFIFVFSIILLQLTLSFAQDGRDSIQLPPLANDAQKLAALLQIKEKVPNLFSDAAKYDIDLFAILDDEKKLLNNLTSNPKYLELFQSKKYYEIKITPPREGLQVGEVSIDPLAIQEWKEQLKNKLNQFKSQWEVEDENSNPLDRIKSEISVKVQRMTEADSSLDGNALLKDLGKIKVNQAILNPAWKGSGAKTLSERLSTVLKVYDQLPEKPASVSSEKLAQALILEQVKSFLELHSVLNRGGQNLDPSHLSWQTVKASLNELGSQDLILLEDNDYLRPIVHQLIPSSHPELQQEILKGIHKNISSFASRTIRTDKKAIDPVTISQQHPIIGIFRGCTGGDCSSQYSFPYPNDPNEKVFFISDKDKKVKGYVSATQVMASGKPSLYVITVSGNRVTAADTELILRGLEKEKANLGVEQILLPAPDKVESLINFPAPRSVYERYVAGQDTIPIQYDHPEIRTLIQSYKSNRGYNRGHYDHMDQNSDAVVLKFPQNSGIEKVTTQTHELPTASIQVPPLSSISMSEVFEFLMDLKRSGRSELEEKVLQIDHIRQSLNQEKYQKLTHFLSTGPSEEPMTIQHFKDMLTNQLKDLDSSLSQYLGKNPSLVYPTVFFCSDAFSPENIEETAKYFLKYIREEANREEANRNFHFDKSKLSQIIEKHILDLNNTERVRKFKDEMLNHLQDPDSTARKKALDSLVKIGANDPHIQLSISRLALQDANKSVRNYALTALKEIKPTDPKIYAEILHALQDSSRLVRGCAVDALGAIKPTDPKIHTEIAKSLQDADENIRKSALDALRAIKPTDPKIHTEIAKSLQDVDENIRRSALYALVEIKPTDPKIHSEISKALQDANKLIIITVLAFLRKIKPTDPKIHFEISKALQDADEVVRESALDALGEIKPADPKIHTEIAKSLQDADENIRRSALDALVAIKPADPKIHIEIVKALQDADEDVRVSALDALGAIKPADPKIHLEILEVALRNSLGFFRKLAIKSLEKIKSSSSEVSKGLLQIAIYGTDLEERTLAIQALGEMDLSNRSIHESLRSEILKNSIDLNHRQDLLPLIQKIMIPFRQTESVNENYCQSLNDILSHDKNVKSLMEFFSNHSGALGVSRSLFEKIGEDGYLLPAPPLSTQAHFNPPSAPKR